MQSGVYIAAVTPFTNDEVDLSALTHNLNRWGKTEIAGILLLGSTSEFVFLNIEEKFRILATARESCSEEKTLLAGIGAESVHETVRLARRAAELGYRYALAVNPYYYKPMINEKVLRTFFQTVADQSPIPVLIYNIPRFTGISIPASLIVELSEHPNIVGIKDSSGNLAQLRFLIDNTSREKFSVFTGDLNGFLQAALMGVQGGIFAFANAVPAEIARVYQDIKSGKVDVATQNMMRIMELANASIGKFGISGLKKLMEFFGYEPGNPRLPFTAPEESEIKAIEQAYHRFLDKK